MPKKVPYLYEEQIERDAAALLAEYEQARGVVITRQVPIENIIEKHLKLGIEFDDMHRLLNYPRSGLGRDPDILGAIFFDERRIVIDESLDPEENPSARRSITASWSSIAKPMSRPGWRQKPTIRRLTVSRRLSRRHSSSRRSLCVSDLKSLGYCTARFRFSGFCPMAREPPFFEEHVKC